MSITAQVVMLFLVVLVGMLCRYLKYFTDETITGVTNLVVNITLPCLTVANMQREFDAQVFVNFGITLVLAMVLILCGMGLGLFLFRKQPHERRAVLANMLGYSNCGFMGYPIILAVNPDLMIYAVAYNIAYTLLSWTLGVSLFRGRENMSVKKALLHPTVISSVIGLIFFCTNTRLPELAMSTLNLVGGLTTPLSMLIIGTRVYGMKPDFIRDMCYHAVAFLRLLALPLAVWALVRLLPLPGEVSTVLFLLTAMPAGTLTAMQAELYGGDSAFAARAIAYTTLLSLATIPVMSMLL